MLRRRRIALASAALALLAGAGVAAGDSQLASDPQGDLSAGGPSRDLKSISHGHTDDGKLVHRVAVYGEIRVTPFKAPLLQLDTEGDNVAEYRVYVGRRGGRLEDMDASTIEPIKARRISTHAMKYVFSASEIGDPASYDWDVLAVGAQGLVDRAPDASVLNHGLSG